MADFWNCCHPDRTGLTASGMGGGGCVGGWIEGGTAMSAGELFNPTLVRGPETHEPGGGEGGEYLGPGGGGGISWELPVSKDVQPAVRNKGASVCCPD